MSTEDIERRLGEVTAMKKTRGAMMDHIKALNIIASLFERIGEPLTETQRISLAGSLAVIIEKAYIQAGQDIVAITHQSVVHGDEKSKRTI